MPQESPDIVPDFTPEELSEINRVNEVINPAFRKALWLLMTKRRVKIAPVLRSAFDEIYNDVEVEINGKFPDGGFIAVANHPTHSNVHRLLPAISPINYAPPHYMMLMDSLARQKFGSHFNFVTRETKPVNALIDEMGYISVESDTPDIRRINRQVSEALSKGEMVAVCPEGQFFGQRENNDQKVIGPIKKGFYHFAKAHDPQHPAPVVPIHLEGFNRAGSRKFTVNIGEALSVDDFENADAMAEHVRHQVFSKEFGFEPVEERWKA